MGKKIKFKVHRLKFKMIPSHIEDKKITGETKVTLYKNPGEKFVFETAALTFDMGVFRSFMNNLEPLKTPDSAGEATLVDDTTKLTIKISATEEMGNGVNWDIKIDDTIDLVFTGDRNELYSVVSDIAPFVMNPSGF